jgi:Na+-transporting NADH:ubiquinone oxidoreductase subunit A
MATAPLASDPMLLIQGKEKSLQLGLKVMQKFTSGKVHVVFGEENALYKELQGVEKHIFTGPHPAGNVGIHIHHIDPLNRGEKVWFAAPQDLVRIAEFLTTGRYPSKKVVSVAGSGAKNRYYYEVFEGAPVADLVKGTPEADLRYINGDVLSGAKSSREGFLGFYSELLTVIPEGRQREFLGWIMPGFNKLGFSKTFFANLFPKKAYALDTNMHGGHRAFIQTGAFEQVLPMDIHPGYLLKSIMAHDIAEMEGLGIYEISEEDFALLAYIDPSKNDIIGIVRSGFDLIRKEA